MTSVGLLTFRMTFAIEKVFPEPVTPSSVLPSASQSLAAGHQRAEMAKQVQT